MFICPCRFAGSLLKRTLSESLAVGGGSGADAAELYGREPRAIPPRPLALAARSLSLELARHKHRLAAHLLSQLAQKIVSGGSCRPVATGNWGCGRRLRGHPQLKLLLQWLAASVAGVPALIYYTFGNEKLFKVGLFSLIFFALLRKPTECMYVVLIIKCWLARLTTKLDFNKFLYDTI